VIINEHLYPVGQDVDFFDFIIWNEFWYSVSSFLRLMFVISISLFIFRRILYDSNIRIFDQKIGTRIVEFLLIGMLGFSIFHITYFFEQETPVNLFFLFSWLNIEDLAIIAGTESTRMIQFMFSILIQGIVIIFPLLLLLIVMDFNLGIQYNREILKDKMYPTE
jgi:hypothetical protein